MKTGTGEPDWRRKTAAPLRPEISQHKPVYRSRMEGTGASWLEISRDRRRQGNGWGQRPLGLSIGLGLGALTTS